MRQSDSANNRPRERPFGPCTPPGSLRLPAAVLLAGLAFGTSPRDVIAKDEIAFGEVRIILETNATDCDVGLQLFFDGDAWRQVRVENPSGKSILDVTAKGHLRAFGLTEQFNETDEPVMEELVEAFPELECDEPEFSLEELFFMFPAGTYQYEGRTIEGDRLEGEATLSHVIPAPAELEGPPDDIAQDPNNTVIEWTKVEEPILPHLGPVTIARFQVIVEREDPQPLVVFTVDLPADATQVKVPPEFLEPGASYKFEVLQIDVSGNQTIAESEFTTAEP
jgi:hypothetical protein